MPTTFDRYLFKRYLSSFVILFVSTYGLYVVIDGFTNMDDFTGADAAVGEVMLQMGQYYSYRASDFFEMVGPILSVVAAVVTLGLLHYQKEIHPILAAGVPAYRLALPLLAGVLCVSIGLVLNTEYLVPQVSLLLQSSRSGGLSVGKPVEPMQDYEMHINIDGEYMLAENETLHRGRFILAAPVLVDELTTLTCESATYHEQSDSHPAGWLLKGVRPELQEIDLSELGKQKLYRTASEGELFLPSQISFRQLYSHGGNYLFDSTPQLVQRINSPAFSQHTINRQILHLHNRMIRPLQNLIAVMVAIPFVLRKESQSLITNMACAAGVLILLLGLQHLGNFLASAKLLTPDFAVWMSILAGGGIAAWFAPDVLT